MTVPHVGTALPGERPGFTRGDPRGWIPGVMALLADSGRTPLPWTEDCDLLVAPHPVPGPERSALIELLSDLPPSYPVLLYERDLPVLPNLLIWRENEADAEPAAIGMHIARSAVRHEGKGYAEACVFLPARRLSYLLRGSPYAAWRPGSGGSLQNRRYLTLALDHQRTLLVLHRDDAKPTGLDPARRALVVAPHFDDETLLCGASLATDRAAGGEARIVWLTDGAQGIPGAAPASSAAQRQEEGGAAAAALGVDDLHFLNAPETGLRRRGPWTRRLRALLQEFEPDRVYLPWWCDNHVDHYESNRVLQAAWPWRSGGPEICAAGSWTPLAGNALVSLDGDAAKRRAAALSCHESQLAVLDYARVCDGLATWYGRDLGRPAECFQHMPGAEYWQAFRTSGAARRMFLGRSPA